MRQQARNDPELAREIHDHRPTFRETAQDVSRMLGRQEQPPLARQTDEYHAPPSGTAAAWSTNAPVTRLADRDPDIDPELPSYRE